MTRKRLCHRHNMRTVPCIYCIRSYIRTAGSAGIMCALCDKVGHTARYCDQTSIGRMRARNGAGGARRGAEARWTA